MSIGVVVLLRSRWGQSRPIHRYALLSLLAHLFLACVATSIQLISGPLGTGDGPPVRVRLLGDVAESPTPVLAVAPKTPIEDQADDPVPQQFEPPELAPEVVPEA